MSTPSKLDVMSLQNTKEILQAHKVVLDRAAFLATAHRSHNAIADTISAIEYVIKHGVPELP